MRSRIRGRCSSPFFVSLLRRARMPGGSHAECGAAAARRRVLVALDHCLHVVPIEIAALVVLQLFGGFPTLLVGLSGICSLVEGHAAELYRRHSLDCDVMHEVVVASYIRTGPACPGARVSRGLFRRGRLSTFRF